MESSKMIYAAILAAGIMGAGAMAWAEPGMGGGPGGCGKGGMQGMGGPGMMRGSMKFDPAARAEQHLNSLKAELKLTAQQEPLWNAFAEKAKGEAGKGMQAMRQQSQGAQDEKLTAPERMAQMNAVMKERLAAHEAVTDAFKRLYDALNPEQRKAADQHMSRAGRMGRGGPGRQPPGPQGMGGEGEHRHG